MSDPLSIIASVITVIGAAEGVSKMLSRLRRIKNAPNEILALINEVSDLTLILGDVERCFTDEGRRPRLSQDHLRTLSTAINRARDKLLELDKLIQYRLVKPDSVPDNLKVSRYEWASAKPTIERFRQSLRDTRLNIVTVMVMLNS